MADSRRKELAMSVDRNRATARRFFEDGWNRRDFAVFDEVSGARRTAP